MTSDLKVYLSQRAQEQKETKKTFISDRGVVDVGVEPKVHYPFVRDTTGKKMKDPEGRDLRADKSDGYLYTFSELGSGKMVKVLFPEKLEVEPLTLLKVSGLGYEMGRANMLYLDEETEILDF